MLETLMMSGCSAERIFRAKIMKWEQMAIHDDCMLSRNSHQLWEDENLAKELQKKFDEEASRETLSRDQAADSSDSEMEVISSSSQIIQINPKKRHRVEISVVLRQSSSRRSQRLRDQSLDYETPRRLAQLPRDRSLDNESPRRRAQRPRDPSLDNETPRRRAQRPRDPSLDNEAPRRRAQRPRDPSLDNEAPRRRSQPLLNQSLNYEDLHDIAERIGPAKRPGLREAEIDMLPNRRFQPTKDPKGRSEAKTCDICLLKWKSGNSIKSLPCFHDFHAKCINDWLKINNSCPVCRLEVTFKNQ